MLIIEGIVKSTQTAWFAVLSETYIRRKETKMKEWGKYDERTMPTHQDLNVPQKN